MKRQESTAFLKKSSKKLFLTGAMGGVGATARLQSNRNFLLLFFKKEALAFYV